ncbi:hypothetical protein FH972_026230 [Carpinus fangiana]|uniref:Nucleoporin Nup159/Nup146 N-terminal domain-containing protein n=1 Tax=Carpinus fangiana TaxID=176857 RepID=A0A5N6L3R2_9ROSI|nr:hypothetical protein FH972_026230 [Carpinus fangiana]
MFGAQSQPAAAQAQAGPELPTVSTENIGFLGFAGDTKIRLLPSSWPENSLPQSTSSLLSVASKKGILAAAGPETVVIASTKTVREAFTNEALAKDGNVRSFTPQLAIPMQQRISQLAFSCDESLLVMTAEEGGGLAVYDVDSVMQGNTQMSFAIPTNNIGVRALIPNPTEAHFFALVLSDGKLMVVNLKDRDFVKGANGPVLREGVSCASWSAKGKQLVAGLGDGTALQLTPDGVVKAELPYPPQVRADQPFEHHVSTISWLNNDTFMAMYTPSEATGGIIPESQCLIIQRQPKTANFTFHRLPDPTPPYGMERTPSHHFICRLKDFPPALNDALIISCSTAGEIGLFTNATSPLASDGQNTANTYTFTTMADDSRRAQLPFGSSTDTSPIGMAIDLSSNDPVKRPIPADSDIDASATPLPSLLVLNHEGILSAWWFVYSDSIRQKTAFPGLVAVSGQQPVKQPKATTPFGGQSQPQASPFGASSTLAVSTPAPSSTFGAPATFGGAKPSPWGSQNGSTPAPGPAFAKPAFGAPAFGTPGASAFGAPAAFGSRQSAWGTPSAATSSDKPNPFGSGGSVASPFGAVASGQTTASPFGAVASSNSSASPFGAPVGDKPSASPFGSFGGNTAVASPFGGLGGQNKPSLFGSTTPAPPLSTGPSFGSTVTIGSSLGVGASFGAPSSLGSKSPWATPSLSNNTSDQANKTAGDDAMMDDESSAETPSKPEQKKAEENKQPTNLFGMPSGGFQLGSQKQPESAKDFNQKPDGNNLFGSNFGAALDKAAQTTSTAVKQEPKDDVLPPLPSAAKQTTSPEAKSNGSKSPQAEAPKTAEAADDPLPPDPITNKKLYESVKDPLPIFGSKPPAQAQTPPKPPPEPAPNSPEPALPEDDDDASLAGSSPVDLGAPSSSETSARREEAAKDTTIEKLPSRPDSPSKLPVVSRPGPAWTFPKAEKAPELPTSSTPTSSLFGNAAPSFNSSAAAKPAVSGTPAATATNPPFLFQRPDAAQDSPRSPSPVRPDRAAPNSGSPTMRRISPMRNRSMQRPGSPQRTPAPAINFEPPKESASTPAPLLNMITSAPKEDRESAVAEIPASPTSSTSSLLDGAEEETGPAVEDDTADLDVEKELGESVEPSQNLPSFIAHQDYVSNLRFPPGLPTSTEKVYRDVQSMIDTLGLNSRALKSFTEWHEESYRDGGRTRSDLANEDDWCLIEVEDLGVLQRDLESHLNAECLESPRDKVAQLASILREISRLRARHADIHRLVALHGTDTVEADRARKTQLTAEQTSTLRDLRKAYAKVQSQLSRAEDSLTELLAKLASLDAGAGDSRAQPTVEAILNTIAKMTRMAETRRNEVDVVEAQLRRAGFRPRSKAHGRADDAADATAEDLGMSTLSLASSQRRSVYGTPRSKGQASPGAYKLEFSSDEDEDEIGDGAAQESPLRNRHASASKSPGKALALRRGVGELPKPSEEALAEYKAKQARKARVFGKLREKIIARTPADTLSS